MRKLKLQMQMSVDGFVGGPNGEMDWVLQSWDKKLEEYVSAITEPVDCIILGRNLAQGFIPAWATRLADPKTADAFARKMVETHKVVFSKTLAKSEWENTDLAKGTLIDEITKLKNESGKDIIVYGGATFVSALIQAKLIDEFHLFINPVAIGNGMSIFKGLREKQNLALVKSKAFDCGIVLLNYEPKQA
jgi:dihydrofolate reductase